MLNKVLFAKRAFSSSLFIIKQPFYRAVLLYNNKFTYDKCSHIFSKLNEDLLKMEVPSGVAKGALLELESYLTSTYQRSLSMQSSSSLHNGRWETQMSIAWPFRYNVISKSFSRQKLSEYDAASEIVKVLTAKGFFDSFDHSIEKDMFKKKIRSDGSGSQQKHLQAGQTVNIPIDPMSDSISNRLKRNSLNQPKESISESETEATYLDVNLNDSHAHNTSFDNNCIIDLNATMHDVDDICDFITTCPMSLTLTEVLHQLALRSKTNSLVDSIENYASQDNSGTFDINMNTESIQLKNSTETSEPYRHHSVHEGQPIQLVTEPFIQPRLEKICKPAESDRNFSKINTAGKSTDSGTIQAKTTKLDDHSTPVASPLGSCPSQSKPKVAEHRYELRSINQSVGGGTIQTKKSIISDSSKQLVTKHLRSFSTSKSNKEVAKPNEKKQSKASVIKPTNADTNIIPASGESSIPQEELKKITCTFKRPKNAIDNFYNLAGAEFEANFAPKWNHFLSNGNWSAQLSVKWPEELSFIGLAGTKKDARSKASLYALHYLISHGWMTARGKASLYAKSEVKDLTSVTPSDITLPWDLIAEIRDLNDIYNEQILPVLNRVRAEEAERDVRIKDGEEEGIFWTEWGSSTRRASPREIQKRNELLLYKLKNFNHEGIRKTQEILPISKKRDEIVQHLTNNQVVIIQGETGCGKSTQVPQFILDHYILNNRATDCNILVSQPRKISALSLADRVAYERRGPVGDVVGYHIRMDRKMPDRAGGGILFASTGIVLKQLLHEPDLKSYSHVILDEAHERDINTDLLLMLLKRAMELNLNLKVVIMSATINAKMFSEYFDNAKVITVPGFTYPVKMHFSEDLGHLHLKTLKSSDMPVTNVKEVTRVINWLHKSKPEGAILCFLPGWAEIIQVRRELEHGNDRSQVIVLAHSRISTSEQRRIFDMVPAGSRKIILSTNIAETGITIDDVVYVVDCGMHKEGRIIQKRNLLSLDNQWISQANVNQRKGRAGRVRSGESFHLFPRSLYDQFDLFPIPEIHRTPLEKVILDSKTYSLDESAVDFLSQLPEPPLPEVIEQAVAELVDIDAIDEQENLTALGRRIALFSLPPKVSKALIHATIFKCVNSLLSIVTILTADFEMFEGGIKSKEHTRLVKSRYDSNSDHVALARIYWAWVNGNSQSLGLDYKKMTMIERLRQLHSASLVQCQMVEEDNEIEDINSHSNRFSKEKELIKSVFLSGVDKLLQQRPSRMVRGTLRKQNVVLNDAGQTVNVSSESVNYDRKEYPSPFMCYLDESHTGMGARCTVRDTSIMSPLSVLLFSIAAVQDIVEIRNNEECKDRRVITLVGKQTRFMCDAKQIDDILEFRNVIWNIVRYYIERKGLEDDCHTSEIMDVYWEKVLIFLCRLLNASVKT